MRRSTDQRGHDTLDALSGVMAQAAVLLAICVTFLIAMWKEKLLPDKYFADSDRVQMLMEAATPDQTDPFAKTAWVYQLLGPFGTPGWVSNTTFALAVVVILVCAPWERLRFFSVPETLVVAFCLVTAAIYLAQYSKEATVLLIVLLVAASPRGRGWILLHCAVMGVYAWWMRPYWGLTAGAYFLLCLVLPKVRTLWTLVLPIVAAYFATSFATSLTMGTEITEFRSQVNDFRTFSTDAKSMIVEFIPGEGPVIGAMNIVIDLVGLVVPFPLLIHRNAMYLAFGAVICCLWVSMLVLAERSARNRRLAADTRLTRAVALLISVVCVQAIFEPDYGSYIKHLTPVLPLFLLVLDRARTREGAIDQPGVGTPAPVGAEARGAA